MLTFESTDAQVPRPIYIICVCVHQPASALCSAATNRRASLCLFLTRACETVSNQTLSRVPSTHMKGAMSRTEVSESKQTRCKNMSCKESIRWRDTKRTRATHKHNSFLRVTEANHTSPGTG